MFDIVAGSLFLLLASPLIVTGMILVRLFMGKPVLFKQERVGRDGVTFELFKLRTMIPDRRSPESQSDYAGPERRVTHKSRHDPRIPPVGAALRAFRFDELPQLWNVVRGDMSLVGPRPELPAIVDHYEEWQHRRHSVLPGVTGLWQVSAPSGKLMHECTDLDLEYIDEGITFRRDLAILMQTPGAMLRRRGF